MKKVISVVLAASMLVGVASAFAGCGELYSAEINWDVDLSTPIKLKGLFPDSGIGAFGDDDTAKIIQKATGYEVEYQELQGANLEGDVSNFLINREPFNFMKLNDGCYTPYLEGGTFLDLTDLLEKTPEGRVLYQLIDLMDYGWDAVRYTDNNGDTHIYGIPDFGYVNMVDNALIWNTNHLAQIGFEDEFHKPLPETLSEVNWALEHLQNKFGPDGTKSDYHALGVPGAANAEVSQIASCFEVPYQFYVNEQGKVMEKSFSENMTHYVEYMNTLYKKGILSSNWNGSDGGTAIQLFGKELHSCIYLNYWSVTPLVNNIVSNIDKTAQDDEKKPEDKKVKTMMGIDLENWRTNMSAEEKTLLIHDELLQWTLRIRGDGFTFKNYKNEDVSCKNQEKAMLPGDPGGVSYYTVIPAYMAENARHVINYLAKKMEAFADFFGGEEGVHWNKLTEKEIADLNLPKAEDYTVETDAKYTEKEDFATMLCFVRPYEYSYTDGRSGEEKTITVKEDGKWIKLTSRYVSQIANNSQYCTGTNAIAAKVYCHLHELGFNAWYYCDNFPDPETYIRNPMYMAPTMKLWGPVNILSRSHLLTGVEHAISAKGDPVATLDINRRSAYTKNYWSDAISDEMTAWYNSSRRG